MADRINSSALDADGLRIWSCVTCRRRKVRCDRREPCANCTRNGIECHFPVTGRLPRRRDSGHPPAGPNSHPRPALQRQAELLSRLRRLEAVVTEMSAQVEEGDGEAALAPSRGGRAEGTPSSSSSRPPGGGPSAAHGEGPGSSTSQSAVLPGSNDLADVDLDEDFGRLIIGKGEGLRVGHHFWTVFCDEIDNIFRAVEDADDYEGEPGSHSITVTSPSPQTALLSAQQINNSLDEARPLPSQLWFIWETYVENVDPFIKILHVPTLDSTIRKLRGINAGGPELEALLFAITLAAVTSMDEEEVLFNFNTPRAQLITRFRLGTEQALSRANYLMTRDVRVLQAFVIYVDILPHIAPTQLAWPLAGLVLRLAASMGLHKDGSRVAGMPELEAEMRRRLWWQICLIDSRGRDARVPQLSVQDSMFDTRPPANINDEDLLPGAGSVSRKLDGKCTVMTIFLIRCEIWRLVRSIEANASKTLQSHLEILQGAKKRIEETYLDALDTEATYDTFVLSISSIWFAKIELIIHNQFQKNPESWHSPNDSIADVEFDGNLKVLETLSALMSRERWRRWRWQLQGLVPWHAIGVVLRRLSQRPWTSVSERAYKAARALLDVTRDDAKGDPLWQPLCRLMAGTERYRERELAVMIETRGRPDPAVAVADTPVVPLHGGFGAALGEGPMNTPFSMVLTDSGSLDDSALLSTGRDTSGMREVGADATWQLPGQQSAEWQTWEDMVNAPALWL